MIDSCPERSTRQRVGVGTAHVSFTGQVLSADRCLSDLLGLPNGELLDASFDMFFRICGPEDERVHRDRLLSGGIPYYVARREAAVGDDRSFPVRVVFSLANYNGQKCLLAVVEDLTELQSARAALNEAETARREVARRLTTAQEKERTRIARELHDDIGQSLAILRIQMLRAGQPVSGMIGKRHPTIPELCEQLKALTEKVSRISHQLHSSELEYVGLAAAIESHCREFSRQYKMAVECVCEEIPKDMDGLLALSILRIVQEALHNAGKHSRAKSIQVAVHGSPSELSLLIADDGVGFDPEQAKLAAGLGLISMRERVYLAGGEFKITSAPGEGTCIAARVPLTEAVSEANSMAVDNG
ncbi:MAG TPA: ATP-binding protein [Candidatus Binatia bacterium]|nr:ATP-binding protein [Candidatus Binatia bacterium]